MTVIRLPETEFRAVDSGEQCVMVQPVFHQVL